MDGNGEYDSDSIGNMRNTRSLSGAGFTLSGKEKRKPFFKKVGLRFVGASSSSYHSHHVVRYLYI